MLQVSEYIASGAERHVYRHPEFSNRVIKIMRPDAIIDRNLVEYVFHQIVGRVSFPGTPRLYGWRETTKGRGLEYEFIADANGSPCKNIRETLHNGVLSDWQVRELFLKFFEEARQAGLLSYDNHPGNFLYQIEKNRIVMIDGFGPRCWNWRMQLRSRYKLLAQKKIRQAQRSILDEWDVWREIR